MSNITSFNCSKCGRVYIDRNGLDTHESHCKGPDDLRCPDPDCRRTYSTRTNLNKHMRLCKEIKMKQQNSSQNEPLEQTNESSKVEIHLEETNQQNSCKQDNPLDQPNESSKVEEKTTQPDTRESTYVKFTHAIEYALLPRFKEWIHLSFYNFGCRLGKEMKGYYRLGPRSREEYYILARDDSGHYKQVYSDKLQEYIGKAVTSSLFNDETNGIVVYVLRECSIFNQEDVQRYLNYFDDPTKEQTQEIMRGIVDLDN